MPVGILYKSNDAGERFPFRSKFFAGLGGGRYPNATPCENCPLSLPNSIFLFPTNSHFSKVAYRSFLVGARLLTPQHPFPARPRHRRLAAVRRLTQPPPGGGCVGCVRRV
ncbi:hypothetical protein GWI33_021480 [Rhynchophorus ferrugineus]|uniref:Uncharacterized protein n=1 Tax=Rhynchophorus ferrugineus TaxID=354439 RepID=A0A834IPI0_RHYFE|nr:hypothetical protein GWI33_021480 [Rhynchophorus ferrugineus]